MSPGVTAKPDLALLSLANTVSIGIPASLFQPFDEAIGQVMFVNSSKGINQTLAMMGTGDHLHQWEWQTSLPAKGPW
jgi:hypothetical protein